MTADDNQPAEGTSGPADDARQAETTPGPSAWWKRQSPKQKREKLVIGAAIIIAALFAWHYFAGKDARQDADISSQVKSSMQQTLDTDSRFSQYHLVVESVEVVKQTGNQYEGLATVRSPKGIDHQVPIQVTADGDNMIWHSEPGAFVWMVLEQLNSPAPTTK